MKSFIYIYYKLKEVLNIYIDLIFYLWWPLHHRKLLLLFSFSHPIYKTKTKTTKHFMLYYMLLMLNRYLITLANSYKSVSNSAESRSVWIPFRVNGVSSMFGWNTGKDKLFLENLIYSSNKEKNFDVDTHILAK